MSAASVFVYAVVLYSAEYLSLKFGGWNPPILGVRYARSFIATTILRVSCIFILFPIIPFIANDSALYSAREELADNVKNVYVGSPQDEQTISTSTAQNICQDHAADCLGVLSWVPADQDSEELQPSTMEEGAVFALVEDRDGTVSSLVNDREVVETEPRSPFDQTWMRPWDKTFNAEADPSWGAGERQDEGYAVAIFSKQVELSDSQAMEVVGAQQWAENLPSTLLYGPNGTLSLIHI